MSRFFAAVCALVAATIFQTGLVPHLAVWGATPNLYVLVVVTLALVQGPRAGMIAGFAGGLLFDLTGAGPIGPGAFVYCLVGYMAGAIQENMFSEGWSLPLVVLFIAAVLGDVVYATFLAVIGETGLGVIAFAGAMVAGAAYTVVAGLLIYPWLARFLRGDRAVRVFRRMP